MTVLCLVCAGALVLLLSLLFAAVFNIRSAVDLADVVKRIMNRENIFVALFRVDKDSEQHGGLLVADVLKAHGVEFIFTLCGGHISPILVSAERLGIRIVDTRHEVTAVFAADAVARIKQTVGVAAVTAGPGVTNTVTAVKNAQMAESPILLLGGAAASLTRGRGALQDIDQMALLRPLCKFSASIKRVADIPITLRRAIEAALSGTPGPVFVELPVDTLYRYRLVEGELGGIPNPKTFGQRAVNAYLDFYLCRMFSNPWTTKAFGPLPVHIPMPADEQLAAAARLVAESRTPLVIVGSQALLPPVEAAALRNALETLGLPCYLGGMARGLLGKDNALHIRQDRRTALKEADLVILAGAVCDFRLNYGRVFGRKSKIVAINRNKEQLYKNSDTFWKPTVAAVSDVATFVCKLADRLAGANFDGAPSEWLGALTERDAAKDEKNACAPLVCPLAAISSFSAAAEAPTEGGLNPLRVLRAFDAVLPDDAILVVDGGDFVGSAAYTLRARGPLQWLDPGAFGTLGVGGGFALGAKLCCPQRSVWIVYGDGSLGYSLIEFDTFARHGAAVGAIVGNDGCWTQIARDQVPRFGSSVACDLRKLDYHEAVKPLGATGLLVNEANAARMGDMLAEAVASNRAGASVLVNVVIGKSSFREGSISL